MKIKTIAILVLLGLTTGCFPLYGGGGYYRSGYGGGYMNSPYYGGGGNYRGYGGGGFGGHEGFGGRYR